MNKRDIQRRRLMLEMSRCYLDPFGALYTAMTVATIMTTGKVDGNPGRVW